MSRFLLVILLIVTAPHPGAAQVAAAEGARVLRQASALRARHQPEAAARLLNLFLSSHSQDADCLTLLAQVRLDQGDSAGAKDLLGRALSLQPEALSANDLLGDLLLKEHRDPEAMDRFETVLSLEPRDKAARKGELASVTELAVSSRKANRPDAALRALEHARDKLPNDPKLLLELGIQATEMGLLDEARQVLTEAGARATDGETQADILYAVARVALEQQQMPAAEADLRAYLARRPADASAHYGLGHILAMEQRPREARVAFERSIRLQPVQTESYYQLGQLELQVQHDAQAEALFQKVLAHDPTHGGALTGIGILTYRKKNYAQAEQYLLHAEKTAPDYQPAHYYRGLALARLGQKEESERELAIAVELDRKQQGPPAGLAGGTSDASTGTAPLSQAAPGEASQ